jgi:hypothetical protein
MKLSATEFVIWMLEEEKKHLQQAIDTLHTLEHERSENSGRKRKINRNPATVAGQRTSPKHQDSARKKGK